MTYTLLSGYKHIHGVPRCPCRDPGNYMRIEQDDDDPLHITFHCWCGSKLQANFDDQQELDEFLALNGVVA